MFGLPFPVISGLPRGLKATPSPCHYAMEKLQLGDWSVEAERHGPAGLPKIDSSKNPAFAAKILYSHGGKVVFEFDYDHYNSNRVR